MTANTLTPTKAKDWLEIYHDNIEFGEKHLREAVDFKDRLAWTWYIAINKRQLRELEAQQPKPTHKPPVIQQIKQNTNIVEVIGRYTRLRGRGNQYYGLCPFHHDRLASLSVDSNKQLWHCFGCGKGGDVIDFVKLAENKDTKEVIKMLAGGING